MEEPVFPQRFFTKGDEPVPRKSIVTTAIIQSCLVSELLHEDEWAELSESKLGFFLKFYKLDFGWASRLVHFMLGFQLSCNKNYEIWSLVGVNPLRFSLLEFEYLTGLNCEYVGDLEKPEVEVTEELTEFWEKLRVHIDVGPSIDELTLTCSLASTWPQEDRIRLGYLAIYSGFIEARKSNVPTRENIARLVMDLDEFENYLWGRVALKNLIQSVKEKDLTKSYTIDGFVEVLQVCVYYAMPDFASVFADHIDKATPPIFGFYGSRGRKNVKEAMIKQTRFNNGVKKDSLAYMFPKWDNEETNNAIDNLLDEVY